MEGQYRVLKRGASRGPIIEHRPCLLAAILRAQRESGRAGRQPERRQVARDEGGNDELLGPFVASARRIHEIERFLRWRARAEDVDRHAVRPVVGGVCIGIDTAHDLACGIAYRVDREQEAIQVAVEVVHHQVVERTHPRCRDGRSWPPPRSASRSGNFRQSPRPPGPYRDRAARRGCRNRHSSGSSGMWRQASRSCRASAARRAPVQTRKDCCISIRKVFQNRR